MSDGKFALTILAATKPIPADYHNGVVGRPNSINHSVLLQYYQEATPMKGIGRLCSTAIGIQFVGENKTETVHYMDADIFEDLLHIRRTLSREDTTLIMQASFSVSSVDSAGVRESAVRVWVPLRKLAPVDWKLPSHNLTLRWVPAITNVTMYHHNTDADLFTPLFR